MSENILEAISQVAKAIASQHTYDQTITAVIIEAPEVQEDVEGINDIVYRVTSDKGATFYAYDTRPKDNRTPYRVHERVRITIPNGDYKEKKIIEGYAIEANGTSSENATTYRYGSFKEAKTIYNNQTAVIFNKNNNNIIDLFNANKPYKYYWYNDINNNSQLLEHNDKILAGYTDIKLNIQVRTNKPLNSENDVLILKLWYQYYDLSSEIKKDNALGFESIDFDNLIEGNNNTWHLQSLYQKNISLNGLSSIVDLSSTPITLVPDIFSIKDKLIKKIWIQGIYGEDTTSNLEFYITPYLSVGYTLSEYPDIYLFTTTPYQYPNSRLDADIVRRCIYAREFILNSSGEFIKENEIDINTFLLDDEEIDSNILELKQTNLSHIVTVNLENKNSNNIVFYNAAAAGGRKGRIIYHRFEDGEKNGNYSIYGKDGKLLAPQDTFITRNIIFSYINTNNYAERPYQAFINNFEQEPDASTVIYTEPHNMIKDETAQWINGAIGADFLKISYTINTLFLPQEATIPIQVKFYTNDLDEITDDLNLVFATSGSTGSDYIVDIKLYENDKHVPAIIGDTCQIRYQVYDYNMNPINEEKIQEISNITNPIIYSLEVSDIFINGGEKLIIKVPIPKRKQENYYANLPSTIIYDEAGKAPLFYKGKLMLYNYENFVYNEIENITWNLNADSANDLKIVDGYLQPLTLFDKTKTEYILKAIQNNAVLWEQPLSITQKMYSVDGGDNNNNMPQINSNEFVYLASLGSIQAFPSESDLNENHSGGFFIGRTKRINTNESQTFYQDKAEISDYGIYAFDKKGTLVFGVDDDGDVQIGRSNGEDNVNINIYGNLSPSQINLNNEGLTLEGLNSGDLYGIYGTSENKLKEQKIFKDFKSNGIRIDKKLLPEYATSHIITLNTNIEINENHNGCIFACNNTNEITISLPQNNITHTIEIEIVKWNTGNIKIVNTKALDIDTGNTVTIEDQYGVAVCKYFPTFGWLTTGSIEV